MADLPSCEAVRAHAFMLAIREYKIDRTAAEDVAQAVSERFLRYGRTLKEPAAWKGWVSVVVLNVQRSRMGRMGKWKRGVLDADGDLYDRAVKHLSTHPEPTALAEVRMERLRAALDAMEPEERALVLGGPGCKVRRFRARQRLRHAMLETESLDEQS